MTNQNGGYIEIENGSDWRKVDEENWDRNRQRMLCQHLGFDEIDGNVIETRQLGSGEQIATGDLICYDTQSSGASCCVHFTPSISTTSTTIPDVRCKYDLRVRGGKLVRKVVCIQFVLKYLSGLAEVKAVCHYSRFIRARGANDSINLVKTQSRGHRKKTE